MSDQGFVVYTTMFVHYDNDGKVYLISNIQDPEKNNFEIDLFLVEDFATGRKSCRNYDIKYFFDLSKNIIPEENTEEIKKVSSKSRGLLYMVPYSDVDIGDLTFYHDVINKKWKIVPGNMIKEELDIAGTGFIFVTKNSDPHFLYNSYYLDYRDLKNGPLEFLFQTEEELELNKVSIFVQRKFEKYVLRKSDEQ